MLNYPVILDEAISYFWSRESLSNLVELIRTDLHPPLNYLLHKLFDFSNTEFGIRWIFFVFFIFSFFYLSKLMSLFLNNSEWKYFYILFLFSSFVFYRTTLARMHSFTFLLAILSSYIFLRLLKEYKGSYLLCFFVLSLFYPLNFYPSISFPFFMYLFLLYKYKKTEYLNKFIFFFLFYILFAFFIIYFFYPGGTMHQIRFELPTGFIVLYSLFTFAFSNVIFDWNLLRSNIVYLTLFGILFCFVFIPLYLGFKKCYVDDSCCKEYIYVNVLSFLSIFFLSIFVPKLLYSPTYLIHSYPLFILLITKGLTSLSKKFKIFFIFVYIFLNTLSIYHLFFLEKENWKEAYLYMLENRKNDEYIFVEVYYPFCFYYNCDDKVLDINKVDFSKEYEKVWLIISGYISTKKIPPLFWNNYDFKYSHKYGNIRFILLERRFNNK